MNCQISRTAVGRFGPVPQYRKIGSFIYTPGGHANVMPKTAHHAPWGFGAPDCITVTTKATRFIPRDAVAAIKHWSVAPTRIIPYVRPIPRQIAHHPNTSVTLVPHHNVWPEGNRHRRAVTTTWAHATKKVHVA